MKKAIAIVTAIIISISMFAQLGVGPIELVKLSPGSFKADDLELLKASTTVFIYRSTDKDKLPQMKKALEEAWTYSKIKLASLEEAAALMDSEGYSFFSIGGISTDVSSSGGGGYSTSHYYLNLWMNKKTKKGKDEKISFCRVELNPSFSTTASDVKGKEGEIMYRLYNTAYIVNWQIGFIKNYLQSVNSYIANGKERWLYMGFKDKDEISKLQSETLYIPKYAVEKDESKLLEDYDLKYKVLPADELSTLILTSAKPIYYVLYIQSCTDKYMIVFNSKTGNIIYSDYSAVKYDVKSSDFKGICKAAK